MWGRGEGVVVSGDFAEHFPPTVGASWMVRSYCDSVDWSSAGGAMAMASWQSDLAEYILFVYLSGRVCNSSTFAFV